MKLNRAYTKTAEFLARQLKLNFEKGRAAPAVLAKHMIKAAITLIDRSRNKGRKMKPSRYAAKVCATALMEFFGYSEIKGMMAEFQKTMETADRKVQKKLNF